MTNWVVGRAAALVGAGVWLGTLTGCATFKATEPIEVRMTEAIAGGSLANCTQVSVETWNGRIEVRRHAGDELVVSGEKHARGATPAAAQARLDQIEVTIEATGDAILVRADAPEDVRRNGGAGLMVEVPASWAPEAGPDSRLRAMTRNGRIIVEDMPGPVVLDTRNGRIEARRIAGALQAETSNGRLVLEEIAGDCTARTSNGRIIVSGVQGNVDVRTTNGACNVEALPAATGRVCVRSSNGAITLRVPASMSADLRLRTSNGRIDTEMPGVALTDVEFGKTWMNARMNGGGGEVIGETSNGSIALKVN